MRKFISPGDIEGKLLKKRNRFISLVRKYPGISRQKCAILMSLSTFNITKLVPKLIQSGMMIENKNLSVENYSTKRSTALLLNPNYEYFAGIDLEASTWRFVILDFAGNIIFSIENDFGACSNREEYLKLLEKCLEEAIGKSGKLWEKVSVLGIGAPGFLDSKSGIITNYEVLPHFFMIPLLDIVRKVSSKPVFIINNTSCLAIYDLWKRPESGNLTVMHVAVRSGISMSLSSKGSVFRGGHNRAGELGISFSSSEGAFLQDICGLSALKRNLPDLPDDFWHGNEESVFRYLRKRKARETMFNVIKTLSMSLATSVALFDPDEIIIYSPLFSEENILWKNLKEEFISCQNKQKLPNISLTRAKDSRFNAAAGAAFFAIENMYPTSSQ